MGKIGRGGHDREGDPCFPCCAQAPDRGRGERLRPLGGGLETGAFNLGHGD